jgi:cation diffusion facilitator family transporter
MWYQDKINTNYLTMIFLTGSFMLVELVVGTLTSSLSLISDGFHMSGDLISLSVGITARIYSTKEQTDIMTYGYKRTEILGGLFNSFFLISVVFYMLVEAIQRIVEPKNITNPIQVLIVGSIGLVINFLGLCLFDSHSGHSHGGHGHSHGGHGHSHRDDGRDHTIEKHKHIHVGDNNEPIIDNNLGLQNINTKAVFLHLLGDALGSVAVIIGALISWLVEWEYKKYIDPIITIIICMIILGSTLPLLKYSILVILQAVPDNIDLSKIKEELSNIQGVYNVHDFHVWLLSQTTYISTLHINCKSQQEFMEVAEKIQKCMHKHNIFYVTIQPEFDDDEKCSNLLKAHTNCNVVNCNEQILAIDI